MASSIQATFGENQPLRSRLVWRTKSGSAGVVRTPPPHFSPLGRWRPKFSERCHSLICACVQYLIRIGCGLPELVPKD